MSRSENDLRRWCIYQRERFPPVVYLPLIAALSGGAAGFSGLSGRRGGSSNIRGDSGHLDTCALPPAVLIHPMVPAEVAGVAFSADPVTGRRRRAVVSAVWGLGLRIVPGESAADLWQIEREGTVAERVVAKKPRAHRIAGIPESFEDKEEREEREKNGVAELAGGPTDGTPAPQPGGLCEVAVDPVEAALPAACTERSPGGRGGPACQALRRSFRRPTGYRMGNFRRTDLAAAVASHHLAPEKNPTRMRREFSGTTAISWRATTE